MTLSRFPLCTLPPDAEALREPVRAFLRQELGGRPRPLAGKSWMGYDAEFSRKLGAMGWIGVTWPKRYGGGEMSAFARYVIVEELLAAGAPVIAHWIADRQSGPLILRYGTQAQREFFLPAICRGEMSFCIGMSEPDSGSDLASIRTRARRAEGGWRINGTKIWTSNAHRCDYMITLVRTADASEKHQGLSQFLVDLKAPGLSVRPIRDLTGDNSFNEVVFQDVLVGDDRLVGQEGNGWAQVVAELALERSGPERFLSCHALVKELMDRLGPKPDARAAITVGGIVSKLAVYRQMSLSIAGRLNNGENPATEAAYVKDLGTTLEQDIPEMIHSLMESTPSLGGEDYEKLLAYITQFAPSFSLRGGTREILRGIIARGLGVR
jgi:Acyl-CoA dehydrogenase, middle domain/Acyl-CoA dehydrogenase, N-terminal domain